LKRFNSLSASAQTAYAQLLDAAHALDLSRSISDLPGTFAKKTVKSRIYWYYQYMDISGQKRQVYVGPDSERVQALVASRLSGRPERESGLIGLARSAVALGNVSMLPKHLAVVQRLADFGLFRAGGVLIGTHAFLMAGNMLGVRWLDNERTQDVDFAHAGKSVSLALPTDVSLDVHDALASLEMGLLPFQTAGSAVGAAWFDPRDPEFQIDFVTPEGRGGKASAYLPQLGTALQPMRFIEFLLEDVQQAVALGSRSATVVNVPSPARLAAHKVLVAGDRPLSKSAKANKDASQAAALISALAEFAPESLKEAFADLLACGPGWVQRWTAGCRRLAAVAPGLDLGPWLPKKTPRVRR